MYVLLVPALGLDRRHRVHAAERGISLITSVSYAGLVASAGSAVPCPGFVLVLCCASLCYSAADPQQRGCRFKLFCKHIPRADLYSIEMPFFALEIKCLPVAENTIRCRRSF